MSDAGADADVEAKAPPPAGGHLLPLTDKLRLLTEHVLRLGANEMQLDVKKRQGDAAEAAPSADTVGSVLSTASVLFAEIRPDGGGEYDQEELKRTAVGHGEFLRESLTTTAGQINALAALHEAHGDMDERGRLVPAVRRDHTGAIVGNAEPAALSHDTLSQMALLYEASKSSLDAGIELHDKRMWRDTAMHYHRGLMQLDRLQTLLDKLDALLVESLRQCDEQSVDAHCEQSDVDAMTTAGSGSATAARSTHAAAGGEATGNQRKQWQSGTGGGGKTVRFDARTKKSAGGERTGAKAAKKRSKRCAIM